MYALVSRYMPDQTNKEARQAIVALRPECPAMGVVWYSCKISERKVPMDDKKRRRRW